MSKIGNDLRSIYDLKIDQYSWTTKILRIKENMSFRILNDSEISKQWILIIKQD